MRSLLVLALMVFGTLVFGTPAMACPDETESSPSQCRLDGYEFEIFELSGSRSPIPAAASIAGHMPKLARAALRSDLIHVHGEVASLSSLPWLVSRPSVVTL